MFDVRRYKITNEYPHIDKLRLALPLTENVMQLVTTGIGSTITVCVRLGGGGGLHADCKNNRFQSK